MTPNAPLDSVGAWDLAGFSRPSLEATLSRRLRKVCYCAKTHDLHSDDLALSPTSDRRSGSDCADCVPSAQSKCMLLTKVIMRSIMTGRAAVQTSLLVLDATWGVDDDRTLTAGRLLFG